MTGLERVPLPELRQMRANLERRVCGRAYFHRRLSFELDAVLLAEEHAFASVIDHLRRLEEGRE